jgi:putative ABC transport system substrate-binding protein
MLRAPAVVLGCATGLARAQAPARPHRLGILLASAPYEQSRAAQVPLDLRELGYMEGGNLLVERRYAERRVERLPALARELVEWRADVIVAIGASAVHAVLEATRTIPTVMVVNIDPVTDGLVNSLARPGGNLTGVTITAEGTLAGKRLELLKEAVPGASRIAFLAPDDPAVATQAAEARRAATTLGITLCVFRTKVTEVSGGT